jgi:hypothetical protein
MSSRHSKFPTGMYAFSLVSQNINVTDVISSVPSCVSFILILWRKRKFSTSSRTSHTILCHQWSPWSSAYFRCIEVSQELHTSLRWQQRTCGFFFFAANCRVCNSTVLTVFFTEVICCFHLYFRVKTCPVFVRIIATNWRSPLS